MKDQKVRLQEQIREKKRRNHTSLAQKFDEVSIKTSQENKKKELMSSSSSGDTESLSSMSSSFGRESDSDSSDDSNSKQIDLQNELQK